MCHTLAMLSHLFLNVYMTVQLLFLCVCVTRPKLTFTLSLSGQVAETRFILKSF